MFAIIECLHHASGVWTRLWQQEVVLEDADASVAGGSVTSAHHLRPIVLQVLHESRLVRLTHEVILSVMARRRATLTVLRRVEKARAGSVRISREVGHIAHLPILTTHRHEAAILGAWWHAVSVEATVGHAAHGATSVRELAALILFVRLVKHVGMAVCRRFSATADGGQVAGVALRAVRALREVTDVELRIQRGQVVAGVAYEGLLAHVADAA